MTTIVTVLIAVSVLFGWIYKLIRDNKILKETLSRSEADKVISEWKDRIEDIEKRVQEDERDYEEAKRKFDSNNPPSGAV